MYLGPQAMARHQNHCRDANEHLVSRNANTIMIFSGPDSETQSITLIFVGVQYPEPIFIGGLNILFKSEAAALDLGSRKHFCRGLRWVSY